MSEKKWTTEQQICIEDHRGTMVVSAAAGSGKTAVLIERIVALCTAAENPVDLDHILVATFTKAAAAEIRARLSAAINKKLSQEPGNARLLRQQFILPRAKIGTIDSFFANLLREHAAEVGVSPQFRMIDEQKAKLLRYEAADEAVSQAYAASDPAFLRLANAAKSDKSNKNLIDIILRIDGFIQSYPFPDAWLRKQQMPYRADCDVVQTLWAKQLLKSVRSYLNTAQCYIRICAALAEADEQMREKYLPSVLESEQTIGQALAALTDGSLNWDELGSVIGAITFPKLGMLTKYNDPDYKKRFQNVRNEARSAVDHARKIFADDAFVLQNGIDQTADIVDALFDLVCAYQRIFAAKKAAIASLDFADVSHLCLSLLVTRDEQGNVRRTALAEEMSGQFEYILVDEYQDTNELQDTIFAALSQEENNLFLVGDIKQSIYGFRQAMPRIFLGRRAACAPYDGEHYPARVALDRNFRSRRQVVDAVNAVFSAVTSEEVCGMEYDERERLVVGADYEDPDDTAYQTELVMVDMSAAGKDCSAVRAEARIIAKRIRGMMEQGLLITENGVRRPVTFRDFCILLRSVKTHGAEYAEELQRCGVPTSLMAEEMFFESAEVRLVMSLLHLLDNPAHDVALLAVMISPLFGFSPDDLAQIRAASAESLFSAVRAKAREKDPLGTRCAEFLKTMENYRMRVSVLPADRLIWALYEELSLPSLLDARGGNGARSANLMRLHQYAHEYEQNGYRGLSAFVRYMDRLKERGINPKSAQNASDNAVCVSTIHHSKGLEYPVVFLAHLSGRFSNRDTQNDLVIHSDLGVGMRYLDEQTLLSFDTLPRRGILEAIRFEQCAEEMRTLYVAMTRAREKLVLVMSGENWDAQLQKIEVLLTDERRMPPALVQNENSAKNWILFAACAGREDGIFRMTMCAAPAAADMEQTETTAEPLSLPADLEARFSYRYPYAALGRIPAKLTASEVSHKQSSDEDVGRSRPAFLSENGMTPAARGTALHIFMQYADYGMAKRDPDAEIARLVSRGTLLQKQADCLPKEKIRRFFESPLYQRMACADRLFRELPFTAERPALMFGYDMEGLPQDGLSEVITVQGIADCAFSEGDKLVVVDYKTDRRVTAQSLCERYRAQVELYAEALQKAFGFSEVECYLYSFDLDEAVEVDLRG